MQAGKHDDRYPKQWAATIVPANLNDGKEEHQGEAHQASEFEFLKVIEKQEQWNSDRD